MQSLVSTSEPHSWTQGIIFIFLKFMFRLLHCLIQCYFHWQCCEWHLCRIPNKWMIYFIKPPHSCFWSSGAHKPAACAGWKLTNTLSFKGAKMTKILCQACKLHFVLNIHFLSSSPPRPRTHTHTHGLSSLISSNLRFQRCECRYLGDTKKHN